jgi:hypothetical protein
MPDAPITLPQLARALAVREVGNSPHAPTRAELIERLAEEIEAAARG